MSSVHGKNFAPLCFAAVMFCVSGCGLFEEEFDIQPAPVARFEVKEMTGRRITFSVTCSWPNGCGRYSHFTSDLAGNQYNVKIFGVQPRPAACTQEIIDFSAQVKITAPVSGIYEFHFWQSETTSLDTSFVIE